MFQNDSAVIRHVFLLSYDQIVKLCLLFLKEIKELMHLMGDGNTFLE